MKTFVITLALVTLAFAGLLGCSPRGALPATPAHTGGAGQAGGGGAGAGGGSGAPGTAGAICQSRAARPPDQLALLGTRGGEIVFIANDGSTRRVPGPSDRISVQQRNGWVVARDVASTTTWRVQLFDASGGLRADAGGAVAQSMPGRPTGVGYMTILADGTTSVDLRSTGEDVVLSPDGRVRTRPFFSQPPDAEGWVATNLHSDTRPLGVAALLNLETGETKKLTHQTPGDEWAPIVASARRLYLIETSGGAALVDESPAGAHVTALPGRTRVGLAIETVSSAEGKQQAYVALWDSGHVRVPLWLYDVATRTLTSALPDGTVPAEARGNPRYGGGIDVNGGGARLWSVDPWIGVIFDYRAGLTVRPTRPPAGGAPDWIALADNQRNLYRYDRARGALEDLHLAGELAVSGNRALVTRDGRPQEIVHVDEGRIVPVDGGAALAPANVQLVGGWAVGFDATSTSPWQSSRPLWRIDLETGATRGFPAMDASLTVLPGNGTAPLFSGVGTPVLPDGRVGVIAYDGVGAGVYLGEPDQPWRLLGRALREATWIGWAAGTTFAIAAEKDCSCYGPIAVPWNPPPAGSPERLPGTSLQFVDPDGADVFPPTSGEHLATFSDASNSCALTRTDAGEWAINDTVTGIRRELGRLDSLSWINDAP